MLDPPREYSVQSVHGSVQARVQLALLRLCARAAKHSSYRVMEMCTRLLARMCREENAVNLTVGSGTLRVHLDDDYWLALLQPGYTYEPEVDFVLRRALTSDAYFVDVGANIGYWSLLAKEWIGVRDQVVAVEASPPTFAKLEYNAAANGDAFRTYNLAVWSEQGLLKTLTVRGGEHAGSSLLPRPALPHRANSVERHVVRTATLDSLCQDARIPPGAPVIVKLDVEGSEVHALAGAADLVAEHPLLLIYEDHGSDSDSLATQFVLDDLKFAVYFVSADGVTPITSTRQLPSIKEVAWTGYNFFATRPGSHFDVVLRALDHRLPSIPARAPPSLGSPTLDGPACTRP